MLHRQSLAKRIDKGNAAIVSSSWPANISDRTAARVLSVNVPH
jgi:hypothetical protein